MTPRDIAAIGITNQRETTLLWDRRSGAPLHNALVWQDTRTDALVARICAGRRQGSPARQDRLAADDVFFSGLKLKWLLDNVPGARAAAQSGDALFGTIDSWLVWNLTGGPTAAARHRRHQRHPHAADESAYARLGRRPCSISSAFRAPACPRSCRPASRSASAREPLCGVPIAGILGDQQAALFGQACFNARRSEEHLRHRLLPADEYRRRRRALDARTADDASRYKLGNAPAVYALEGSIAIAGALVQWLRDNLGLIETSAEDRDAGAYRRRQRRRLHRAGILRPLCAALARRCTRRDLRADAFADRGHIARAALEATAFQTREVIAAMSSDSGVPLRSCASTAAWWSTTC